MTIEEVIGVPQYTLPIHCDEPYHMKIMVEGKTKYYKPVDFSLNQINVPLHTGDVNIVYDECVRSTNVFKNDVITSMYYPPSTKFTTIDGVELIVLKYGPIKKYKGMVRLTVYCKLADETQTLVETIPNKPVLDKILKEMNSILISNEELKNLLPSYNYNWMLYDNNKADDAKEAKSHVILDDIGFFEYQEQFAKQQEFISILETDTTVIPPNTLNELYNFGLDFTRKRYPVYYNNVVKMFRMKAVANWLIYITENINKTMDYSEIAILNKYRDYMRISIGTEQNPVVGIDIEFNFSLPEDSRFNYRLKLYQVSGHLDYVAYNIDAIRLFQINKATEEEVELINASMQPDNFDSFVRVLEILSGYDHNRLMCDYYNDIANMIDDMDVTKPSIAEDTVEMKNDESDEQRLERYINTIVDEKSLPRIQEILASHILEGSLYMNEDGTLENVQTGGSSVVYDNSSEVIIESE